MVLGGGLFNVAFASYPGPDSDYEYCSYGQILYASVFAYYVGQEPPRVYDVGYWYSSRASIYPYNKFGWLYVHYWNNQVNNPYFSPVTTGDSFWISPIGGFDDGTTDIYGQTGSYFYVTFPNFFWVQTYTAHNHAT